MMMMRKQSQQSKTSLKKLSIYEKIDLSKNLLKVIQYGEGYSLCNTLFGYTLAYANIPLNNKVAYDLKQKFGSMQELYFDRVVSSESITLVVIDAIESKKQYEGDQRGSIDYFMNMLTFDFEETLTDPHYIYEKWEKDQRIEEETARNEIALKRFLEEEKQEIKKVAEEAESQGWECPVCCSEIDRNSFGILQCGHIFHPQCINAYLKSKIQSNEVEIICPMQGCNKHLDVGDIYGYIDGDLKEKYEKFSFNKFVEKNNASTAWCPTAGCQAVFEFQELDNYRCPACNKHYCLRCKCQYHNGMTCAEYKINNSFDKNDQDFIKFVQGAKYKQCPRCKFWVERNDGCSTMTCKCGQEFCYDCGGTTCPHGMCNNSGRVGVPHPVIGLGGRIIPAPVPPPPNIFGRPAGGKRRK